MSNINLMIIGDSNVGKTNLCTRYVNDQFSEYINPTIAADLFNRALVIKEHQVNLKIWDTAGQEKFQALGKSFFKQAHAIILVYDCSSQETYDHLNKWMAFIKQNTQEQIVGILIGNKIDLKDKQISTEQGKNFAIASDLFFIETSAKDNKNVQEAFTLIVEKALEKQLELQQSEDQEIYDRMRGETKQIVEVKQEKKCCQLS